jgi:hypothetical protein
MVGGGIRHAKRGTRPGIADEGQDDFTHTRAVARRPTMQPRPLDRGRSMFPASRHPMVSMVAVIACMGAALTSAMAQAPRLALAWFALSLIAAGIAERRVAAHRRAGGRDAG